MIPPLSCNDLAAVESLAHQLSSACEISTDLSRTSSDGSQELKSFFLAFSAESI
jgi:hypothetical protein